MKRILTILIFAIPFVVLGQANKQHEVFVFETNLPDEVRDLYEQKIKKDYSLRTDVNPFYLKGDFDGDKKLDYAINVIERKTNKKGIVIYHTGTSKHFIIGAGQPFNGRHPGDDFWWMDAWKVTVDKNKKANGILVIKTESSSGLIYWTGQKYNWQQEGD
jgi:hypothetical protein